MTTSTAQITTVTTNDQELTGQQLAWRERQKDSGWGWAWAHLLPFGPLAYAIQRRTITPLLYCMGGSFGIAILVVISGLMVNENMNEDKLLNYAKLATYAATPVLAKQGIDKARKFAATKLGEGA